MPSPLIYTFDANIAYPIHNLYARYVYNSMTTTNKFNAFIEQNQNMSEFDIYIAFACKVSWGELRAPSLCM